MIPLNKYFGSMHIHKLCVVSICQAEHQHGPNGNIQQFELLHNY